MPFVIAFIIWIIVVCFAKVDSLEYLSNNTWATIVRVLLLVAITIIVLKVTKYIEEHKK